MATLLRHAGVVDLDDGSIRTADVLIEGDTVAAVSDASNSGRRAIEDRFGGQIEHRVELAGWLLLPSAVEPHAHLDKAFLAERVPNPTGDLAGAVDAMRSAASSITVQDIEERAERAARRMAANGYTAVRTHVDLTIWNGLRSVEALNAVRTRLAAEIDIEIVGLSGPVVGADGDAQLGLVRDALDIGLDLVGGCPHLEDDVGDIAAGTHRLLEVASDAGVGVDLHTDETLDPMVRGLEVLADAVLGGFPHPVTASHCVSLGQRPLDEQRRVAERVAAAGIGVVTLPHTNLWLGGRDAHPVARGLTAIDALRAAGVDLAAGADNLQDPFNPLGRACPFETAALMVLAAHDLPHIAWASVSSAARAVMGRDAVRIGPGAPADLLAVEATSLRQAIAEGAPQRIVFRAGHRRARTVDDGVGERGGDVTWSSSS
jgi:cytosine deaminase